MNYIRFVESLFRGLGAVIRDSFTGSWLANIVSFRKSAVADEQEKVIP